MWLMWLFVSCKAEDFSNSCKGYLFTYFLFSPLPIHNTFWGHNMIRDTDSD